VLALRFPRSTDTCGVVSDLGLSRGVLRWLAGPAGGEYPFPVQSIQGSWQLNSRYGVKAPVVGISVGVLPEIVVLL
jgi:hypothetical protein